jgi:uncharacterized protein (TIGR00251 family)
VTSQTLVSGVAMGLMIVIKVVPGSGKQKFVQDKAGSLKCFLKNQAEQGRANAELIKYLAHELNITQQQVTIVSGHITRSKKLKIDCNLTKEQLYAALGIEQQTSLL